MAQLGTLRMRKKLEGFFDDKPDKLSGLQSLIAEIEQFQEGGTVIQEETPSKEEPEMTFLEQKDFMDKILNGVVEANPILRVEILEPDEAFSIKVKGFKSFVVESDDCDSDDDFRVLFHRSKRIVENSPGRSGLSSNPQKDGYGLTFVKGTIEESMLLDSLSPRGKQEFRRFVALSSAMRRSAISDIAETVANIGSLYSIEFQTRESGLLRIEGKPLVRFKPNLIPSSIFEKMDYNYHHWMNGDKKADPTKWVHAAGSSKWKKPDKSSSLGKKVDKFRKQEAELKADFSLKRNRYSPIDPELEDSTYLAKSPDSITARTDWYEMCNQDLGLDT